MRAAGLIPIHTLLSSQAVLIRNASPAPANLPLIDRITSRIEGVIAAGKYVLCNYNVERKHLKEATEITPGRRAATVSPLDDKEWVAVSSMCVTSSCSYFSALELTSSLLWDVNCTGFSKPM
jgi:ATP phosphoribosyltransferase